MFPKQREVMGQNSAVEQLFTIDTEQTPVPKLNVDAIRDTYNDELSTESRPIRILRSIFSQLTKISDNPEQFEVFTNRALLTQRVYQDELVDQNSSTGKNTVHYSEILDLIEPYEQTTPFMVALNQLLKDRWVQDNQRVKLAAVEAFAIASIMLLDYNHVTPSFMQDNDEQAVDRAQ
jgi:hypothetical protein